MVCANDRTRVQRSISWHIRGKCSHICIPAARVELGRNSPRTASGASGFISHMSMVAGPPFNQTKMTARACAFRSWPARADEPFASSRSNSGSVRPNSPEAPTRSRSRRRMPKSSQAKGLVMQLLLKLVVQHELAGIDQPPKRVCKRHRPVGHSHAIISKRAALVRSRPARQGGKKQFFNYLLVAFFTAEQPLQPACAVIKLL